MTKTIFGPFAQIITLDRLPIHGPIRDESLEIRRNQGILVQNSKICRIAPLCELRNESDKIIEPPYPSVAVPGLVDAHTHICWAGSRAQDYAKRLQGVGYQEIAAQGGGILDTVRHTREATREELTARVVERLRRLLQGGVRTVEVKSGYGLSVSAELNMLEAIQAARLSTRMQVLPTCLAAHTLPPEFTSHQDYLQQIETELLPQVLKKGLAQRVDIFVEEGAFSVPVARHYLKKAREMGFDLTIHADQFSRGAAQLAAELKVLSADHLEVSEDADLIALRDAGVVATLLPGASLGLGLPFAPARRALDLGLCVAIASDWNPGSAPMGDLLTQAALLGAAQRLSMAETWAGITVRAAKALGLHDRGVLAAGKRADFTIFPCSDYREILYAQGGLRPLPPKYDTI